MSETVTETKEPPKITIRLPTGPVVYKVIKLRSDQINKDADVQAERKTEE